MARDTELAQPKLASSDVFQKIQVESAFKTIDLDGGGTLSLEEAKLAATSDDVGLRQSLEKVLLKTDAESALGFVSQLENSTIARMLTTSLEDNVGSFVDKIFVPLTKQDPKRAATILQETKPNQSAEEFRFTVAKKVATRDAQAGLALAKESLPLRKKGGS